VAFPYLSVVSGLIIISGLLQALTGPLIRPRPLRYSLLGALGLSIDSSGCVLFSGFGKGDGHPDGIPFFLKFHDVLLLVLAYLPIPNIQYPCQT
jgi:hypothetical protein